MTDDGQGLIRTEAEGTATRTSRRRRLRRGPLVRLMARTGPVLGAAVLVAAPLAAGGVHRVPMVLLMLATAAALALLAGGVFGEGRSLRIGAAVVVPVVFLLIPILQSVPLPRALRGSLDREGNALLEDNPVVAGDGLSPMSLDPPNTRAQVGRAAAALAMFVIAFHLASGQRRRHLIPRLVAVAGIAAVAIGLGHRIFGVNKIYGVLASGEALLKGPFVNKNHNAEFLELAAFACLACSLHRASALNRVGWMVGVLFCAVGAAGTLSRGAALALAVGALAFLLLRHFAVEPASPSNRRASASWVWVFFLLALIVLTAGALGAGQLVERFQRTAVTADVRFRLWRDSLSVLAAHPLGIGRGAFGAVYPVYRTLIVPMPLRFSFVENEPLQLLLEVGWVGTFAIAAGIAFLVSTIIKQGRRDLVEAAILSGLIAVLTHSLVDFGLETMGVLLPFMAMLGVVLGRSKAAETSLVVGRPAWATLGLAMGGLVFGAGAIAHASFDDFDARVRRTPKLEARRELLVQAQRAHPVDYFYALASARTEPLRSSDGAVSPRLHALNHALRLCPSCELVHMDVARNLWAMSLRSQSLVEWREVLRLQPAYFEVVMGELTRSGARPEQLAAIAASDPKQMIDVANYLMGLGRADAALTVLDQADALGAPRVESLLTRGRLQVRAKQVDAALATVAEAHGAKIQDPRLVLLDAEVTVASQGAAGADAALAILDSGAARYPEDLAIQRLRVNTVLSYGKWQAAARAVDGLKMALYANKNDAGEAHVAAARMQVQMSHWTAALGEYRIALADAPNDVQLWMEFGRAAESTGRDQIAREAYTEAVRLSPSNADVRAALQRVDARQTRLRASRDPFDVLGGGVGR